MADYNFSVLEITPHLIQSLSSKIGGKIMIATDERGVKFLNRCENGEIINVDTRKVDASLKRVHEQNNLYWAACELVSENTTDYVWNTQEKVDTLCRINSGLITGFTSYYDNNECLKTQLLLGSISFKELEHLKACNYFTNAFDIMAHHLHITVDELIQETKNKMNGGLN